LIGVGLATFNCVPISTPEPKTNMRVNSVKWSVMRIAPLQQSVANS
jgi:hypothetical protein